MLLLSIMFLRCTQAGEYIDNVFLFTAVIFHCTDIPQFIHSINKRHLHCFQSDVIMNKIIIIVHIQVFFPTFKIL